ncbi:MAG TPA: hypothetical protein VFP80_08950, partial [Thermoanaerobaculia bacterium]|nr:hypothetical protein [Thermoanaerobaculia bacterium]
MNTIDETIAALYESVCFEEGQLPDWSWQEKAFAPGARLVRVTDDGVFEFDLPAYRANIEALIDSGAVTSFWEAETSRETRELGPDAVHVFSAYEARRSRGGAFLYSGVNSIQLFRRDGRWWVSAMI